MDVTNPGEYERQLRREARGEARRKRESGGFARPQKTTLRIIAGDMRTRKIEFRTDANTRPMKDRTREAIFSRMGSDIEGTIAVDLFAGSGILAFESLSRGAVFAIAVEKEPERVVEIQENARRLKVEAAFSIHHADAFRISHNPAKLVAAASGRDDRTPWTVFCCPPYSLWESELDELKRLLATWLEKSPPGSNLVVEFHESTDPEFLISEPSCEWFLREYRPALVAIGSRTGEAASGPGD